MCVNNMRVFLAGGQGQLQAAIPKVAGIKAESGEVMKTYLAESGGLIFNDANILQSFYYADDFTEKIIIPNCQDFMLDSGAFTFMQNAKKQVNWEDYVERYQEDIACKTMPQS